MIKQEISCDVTKEKLEGQALVSMTTCSIQFKQIGGDREEIVDGKKVIKKDGVIGLQNYAFHISAAHAPGLMKVVQKFFDDKEKELKGK